MMRSEEAIKDRLQDFERNLMMVERQRMEFAIPVIKQAILELSWVLGSEINVGQKR